MLYGDMAKDVHNEKIKAKAALGQNAHNKNIKT
jgi:hypothetical protein